MLIAFGCLFISSASFGTEWALIWSKSSTHWHPKLPPKLAKCSLSSVPFLSLNPLLIIIISLPLPTYSQYPVLFNFNLHIIFLHSENVECDHVCCGTLYKYIESKGSIHSPSSLLSPGLEFDDDQLLLRLLKGFVQEPWKALPSFGTSCQRKVIVCTASERLLVMPCSSMLLPQQETALSLQEFLILPSG